MSRSTPFHKQTDPNKQAGQVVYSFDREPYLKHSNAAPYEPRVEQTLNEYIKRKEEEPPRIAFAEWSKDRYGYDLTELYLVVDSADMLECWNTAIKHGKISP